MIPTEQRVASMMRDLKGTDEITLKLTVYTFWKAGKI